MVTVMVASYVLVLVLLASAICLKEAWVFMSHSSNESDFNLKYTATTRTTTTTTTLNNSCRESVSY